MAIDLLVFGPHPDDLEIGLGGTIARHTAEGRSVGLIDLTAAELSSNGTPAERQTEAAAAARVLGASFRENLGWPDGGVHERSTEVCDRSRGVAIRLGLLLLHQRFGVAVLRRRRIRVLRAKESGPRVLSQPVRDCRTG